MTEENKREIKQEIQGAVDITLTREQVWLQAWCSTATANDCKSPHTATKYADACLDAFDARFRSK